MAVKLRLKRFGRNKKPVYRLVVASDNAPRDGSSIEDLGFYDPLSDPVTFNYKEERIQHWLSNGAQPTNTVNRLLAGVGLIEKKTIKSSNQGILKKDRQTKKESSE